MSKNSEGVENFVRFSGGQKDFEVLEKKMEIVVG